MAKVLTQTAIQALFRAVDKDGVRRELGDLSARGLILRAGAGGRQWTYRTRLGKGFLRVVIGDFDEWSLEDARDVARAAARYVKANRRAPSLEWWEAERIRFGKSAAGALPARDPAWDWTLEQAAEKFIASLKNKRREPTITDKRSLLAHPKLKPLQQELVSRISRRDLAKVVAKIHESGTEARAEHVAGALRTLWTWLEDDVRVDETRVRIGEMVRLKAPERSRLKDGEERKSSYVPTIAEVGRILAIARSGALNEPLGAAIELMVMSAQRRYPVASARQREFVDAGERGGLWRMPAQHRKTAERRRDLSDHVVPVPHQTWRRIKRQIAAAQTLGSEHVFPADKTRSRSKSRGHMADSTLTRTMMFMPRVNATPHALRRTFATFGEIELGNTREQSKLVLDHNENVKSGDVTRESYALHDNSHLKWPIVLSWSQAVEAACEAALATQYDLKDPAALRQEITKAQAAYVAGLDKASTSGLAPAVKPQRAGVAARGRTRKAKVDVTDAAV